MVGHGVAYRIVSFRRDGTLGKKIGGTFSTRPRGLDGQKECVNNGEDRFPSFFLCVCFGLGC